MIVTVHPNQGAIYPVQIDLTRREALILQRWAKGQAPPNAVSRKLIEALVGLKMPTPEAP